MKTASFDEQLFEKEDGTMLSIFCRLGKSKKQKTTPQDLHVNEQVAQCHLLNFIHFISLLPNTVPNSRQVLNTCLFNV